MNGAKEGREVVKFVGLRNEVYIHGGRKGGKLRLDGMGSVM